MTMSPARTEKATQHQTMVSVAPGIFSNPNTPWITRTSRKIRETAKLRVIHWRCCWTLPLRMKAKEKIFEMNAKRSLNRDSGGGHLSPKEWRVRRAYLRRARKN